MAQRRYTKELLKAQDQGRVIVVASCMIDQATRTGEVHVRYAPRYTTDAHPWIETHASGDGAMRYSGREVTLEARYLVEQIDEGYFQVIDVQDGTVHGTFDGVVIGQTAYRRADLHALNLNREDRRAVMGPRAEAAA